MQRSTVRRRNGGMSSCAACSASATAIVVRGADVAMLGKLLQQQKREGQAAVQLIESADVAPARGASEPGKGSLVDVVA